MIHSFIPHEHHKDFIKHYGAVDAEGWELARFRAIYLSSTISKYAYEIKNENFLREALQGLRYINYDCTENF